jgi:hypothetical protein
MTSAKQTERSKIMKTITCLLSLLFLSCLTLRGQELSGLPQPPNGNNQKAEISQWIGPVQISIAYHSPRVHFQGKERTGHIWGELVQYGFFDDGYGPSKAQPWRVGANETTSITFSHDVKVEGKEIKAGTYGLFLCRRQVRTVDLDLLQESRPGRLSIRSEERCPACLGDAPGRAVHRIFDLRL